MQIPERTKIDLPHKNIPLGLSLNLSQAKKLLKGLELLPDLEKKDANYISLKRDLETIVVIWERRIKNDSILKQLEKNKHEPRNS